MLMICWSSTLVITQIISNIVAVPNLEYYTVGEDELLGGGVVGLCSPDTNELYSGKGILDFIFNKN